MKTRLTVMVSTYKENGNILFEKLILVDKDLSNVPPIEEFVSNLQVELLPDFKKENADIAKVIIEKIVIIDSVKSVAHTVWPKPDKKVQ